jgi:sporulation protein YlmC with PRC-barrel domain
MAQGEPKSQWTGHDLFDLDGDRVGTVEDALHVGTTGDPEWLVVETGGPETKRVLVPAGEVRRAGDRLTVLHTKERVENAPKVEHELFPTDADEQKLCRYYGLQHVSPDVLGAEGCAPMEDLRPGG